MGTQTVTFLSACLLALKGYTCQSVSYSSSSGSVSSPNAITVPAIIKPVVQPYESNSFLVPAPSVPSYGAYGPPPLPPIIIDGGRSGGGNSFSSLLFLLLVLNNNRRGGGGGCGGCGGCGGYGVGYRGGCGGGSRGGNYPYGGGGGVEYDIGFFETGTASSNSNSGNSYANVGAGGYGGGYPNAGAGSSGNGPTNSAAEVTITEGYYVDEVVTPNPYQYIQPYPSKDPYEVFLTIRADYPPPNRDCY